MTSNDSTADAPGNGRLVVLADDSAIQRTVLSVHLKKLGFVVIGAEDGGKAFEEAKRNNPDVIVSDLTMPEVGGFDLCKRVRGDAGLKAVPVILTSASPIEETQRRQASEAHADAIVHRTPGFDEIIDALMKCLESTPGR